MKIIEELFEKEETIDKNKIKKILKRMDTFLDENREILTSEKIENFYSDVEELFDDFLTKEEAEGAVTNFVNTDGTHGEHWSLNVVEDTLKQRGIPTKTDKYSLYDIYYMINCVYSDASERVRNNVDIIIEQALSKLSDPDFYAGGKSYSKAYVEWKDWLKKEYGECEK